MDYGAVGDNSTDDRDAIIAAIAAARAAGGGTVTTSPGKIHHYSGRITLLGGVLLDFGNNRRQTAPAGSYLVATSTTGGIDLVPGSHIRATLRCLTAATFTGPMLDINDANATEFGFGRNQRHATFDVDIYGGTSSPEAAIGLRYRSASSANGGVSWVHGKASVGEMGHGCLMETTSTGYINENWLDLITFGCVWHLRGTVGGSGEIAANRIRCTLQTIASVNAKRAIQWDGVNNDIEVTLWDWVTGRVDTSEGGHPIELTATSGGNDLRGFVPRGTGGGGFTRNPVIDKAVRTTNKNVVNVRSGRFAEGANLVRNMPANSFEQTFAGDQDDSFAYATRRYTVTASGTTTVDSTSLRRLFEPNEANLSIAAAVDFTIKVDLGVAPGKIAGMGVSFTSIEANRPISVKVEGSTNDSTWTTVMEAGFDNDPVPQHLFRLDQPGNYRYWRLVVTGDSSRTVTINRWWGVDLGFNRLQGMFPHIYNPTTWGGNYLTTISGGDGYFVNGVKVVGAQGALIADVPTGGSATAAANATAINSILARLRAHGLIAT
jgi:hypothetical protein